MADGERTQPPTPRRLVELRRRGDVPRSAELNTAVTLLVGAITLRAFGPAIVDHARAILSATLLHPSAFTPEPDALRFQATDLVLQGGVMLVPLLLAVMVSGIFSSVIQVGTSFTPSLILPKWSRIDPLAGLRRLFSVQGLFELGKATFKVLIVGAVIYHALAQDQDTILMLLRRDVMSGAAWFAERAADVMVRVSAVFLILAGGDYLFARWRFLQRARMTREELREELRSTEGSPEMRSRMRQYARTIAMSRMMQAVPSADVVITNPTHLAVALKYEVGTRAPRVIAKGQRLIAQRIKEIARNAGIPVIENRPLAAALFKSAEVGSEIPAALYQVVAEVLAFVYRLRAPRMRFA